jgi:hypothetical protein
MVVRKVCCDYFHELDSSYKGKYHEVSKEALILL